MKCANCGANLEIDTAFCPYCGTANPVAKKHREDMARYEKDYKNTKAEDLDNTRRFNGKTLRIAVVAVTVALIAIFITLSYFSERLARSKYREKNEEASITHLEEVKGMIDERDYIELARLIAKEHISFPYKTELDNYRTCGYAARNYADLFTYVMRLAGGASVGSSFPASISSEIKYVFKYAKEGRESEIESVRIFSECIERDTLLLLETYLGLSKEESKSLLTCTDAQMGLILEEAFNEITGK